MVSGKEFRASLRKAHPGAKTPKKCRLVPAFTIQAFQRDTCVIPPPKCDAYKVQPPKSTKFRDNYRRGNLPLAMEAKGGRLAWKVL